MSRDGRILAAVGRDDYVRFFEREGSQLCLRQLLLLPQELQQIVGRLTVVRLSPRCLETPEDRTQPGKGPLPLLLLSDGVRLIVLDPGVSLQSMNGSRGDKDAFQRYVVADYHLGDRFGKLTYTDFLLDQHRILVCFELGVHASILSLSKPNRDDIADVKFNDSQGWHCLLTSHMLLCCFESKATTVSLC